jgi:hypothetical protein
VPYYSVGDYYGRGDYYRGDPFLGGLIKKIGGAAKSLVGGVAKVASNILPLPFSLPAKVVSTALATRPAQPQLQLPTAPAPFGPAATPMMIPGFQRGARAYRRMDPLNVKALRRASRRVDAFVRTTRKALKHTGFTIVSRASRRGSPGVITRSEAARALKR